jgi:hypothetical protein
MKIFIYRDGQEYGPFTDQEVLDCHLVAFYLFPFPTAKAHFHKETAHEQ